LPGISTSKTSGALTSSLGSMMLSASGSPSSYSPTGSRPGPSPLVRSASFQSRSVAAFLSQNLAHCCFC
jgi:hypothetical protein